jgi:hypothetical protein
VDGLLQAAQPFGQGCYLVVAGTSTMAKLSHDAAGMDRQRLAGCGCHRMASFRVGSDLLTKKQAHS